jgi:hypothetical protein
VISVIVPTIKGREEWLKRCIEAYGDTCPDIQLVVIRNRTACGIAWIEGATQATGDYLHFTADDLVPQPGWWEAAVAATSRGALPAATVLTDGLDVRSRMNCTVPLQPGVAPPNVLVPFFGRAQFDLGGWLVPIHYGSDDWVTFLACKRGIELELAPGYAFEHSAAEPGRLYDNRRRDVPELCRLMEAEWFMPDAYRQIAHELAPGWAA